MYVHHSNWLFDAKSVNSMLVSAIVQFDEIEFFSCFTEPRVYSPDYAEITIHSLYIQ